MTRKSVDVAILGGGLAGNLLARQLRREHPNLSVALFEKSVERGYKVGESTVEIATQYLVRRLGLSTYIYKEHLPKNGLRYFFDSPEKDQALPEMSEIGIHGLPPYPSFQLDRARFEADLLEMNAKDGVDIHLPARIKSIELSESGEEHQFVVSAGDRETGGEETTWSARWLIDATGRESMIARARDLRVPEKDHRIAAAWGRARGVADMDDLDAPEFLARARHTSRVLSTNHFMYQGYWIWFIPLREGLTSIGIVQEREQWSPTRHKPEGFLEFLRGHRAVASLVEDVELIDLAAYTQLAFRTRQFFSTERWACIGDAAAFTDPFYSPGSDFIALENDFVSDLIGREVAGENIDERTDLYDRFMQFRFDTTMVIYESLYPTFGSYELYSAKVYFDTACYYNLLFDSYARDEHRDLRWLRSSLRRRDWVMTTMSNFKRLFRGASDEMLRRGTYHRKNAGHFELEGRKAFGVMEHVGVPRRRREVNERNEAIFQRTQRMVSGCLDDDGAFVKQLQDGTRELYDAWSQLESTS